MSGFVVMAGFLTLLAVAAVMIPLLREKGATPVAWRSAGVFGLLVLLAGAGLYPVWSNFKWNEPEPALDSPAAMVGRLARRLEKEPDDLNGWLLLGRSYSVIEQFPLAIRAYQRADTLANGQSAEAAMGLAEALVNSGSSDLSGRAGQLFERALELDGTSVRALLYGALVAQERNDLPLARERFMRLLSDANAPPEVRQLIEEQIQAIDAMTVMAQTPGPETATPPAATTQAVSVPLRITLASAVAGNAADGAPMFVSARLPGQRMPLAAKRLEARFPQDVELLSTDAVMGGGGFVAGQEIEVEARIANGGSAISRSGDPFGSVTMKVGAGGRVSIQINQLKP